MDRMDEWGSEFESEIEKERIEKIRKDRDEKVDTLLEKKNKKKKYGKRG